MNKPRQGQLNDINVTTVAPTITDDVSLGYAIGSKWLDTITSSLYICEDATAGAAVWTAVTGSSAVNVNAPITGDGSGGNPLDFDQSFNFNWTGTHDFSILPTSVVIPVGANDLVNKAYVDTFALGLQVRASCAVATITTLPANTYNNGAAGVGATLTANANGAIGTIDGYAVQLNDRILVKDEAAPENNGIYEATDLGDGSNPYILTRVTDYDQAADITTGTFTSIINGTQMNTQWVMDNSTFAVVGTDPITFSQLTSLQAVSIGDTIAASTPGSILYIDASNNLAQDNSNLFYDETNNRLGLGTVAPSQTLHVVGNAIITGGSGTTDRLLGKVNASGLINGVTVGSGLSLAGNTLSATGSGGTVTSVAGANSIVSSPNPIVGAGTLSLVNDSASPGNNKVYSTDGTGTRGWFDPAAGFPSLAQRRAAFDYFTDFLVSVGGSVTSGNAEGLINSNSGASAASSAGSTFAANRPGIVNSVTGSTATGYTNVYSWNEVSFAGGTWVYEVDMRIPSNLSVPGQRYQVLYGFFDTVGSINQTDGIYFLYDEGGVSTGSAASANWQIVTASGGVRTFTTTATAVATGTWIRLRIEVNAAGTLVDFLINGSSVGTSATNIPANAAYGFKLVKSVGAVQRDILTDYLYVHSDFTTSR